MTMRNRKSLGIEPIVAAILLIVITVVAAVLLYMWLSGYVTATTGKVSSMAPPAQFQVVAVSLSVSKGLSAYVQNTGPVTITITGVYLLNATNNNLIGQILTNATSKPIPPGSTVYVVNTTKFASTLGVTPGITYELLFVTSSGTKYTITVVASS